jgi:hypothetical protein
MMKEKMMFGALLAGLAVTGLLSADAVNGKGHFYSTNYSQWGQDHQKSGLFASMQKKPLTDTELLSQLDKKGREKYRGLSKHDQQYVLAVINQSGVKNYNRVIDDAIARHRESVEREQIRMLHNGMDRINSSNN